MSRFLCSDPLPRNDFEDRNVLEFPPLRCCEREAMCSAARTTKRSAASDALPVLTCHVMNASNPTRCLSNTPLTPLHASSELAALSARAHVQALAGATITARARAQAVRTTIDMAKKFSMGFAACGRCRYGFCGFHVESLRLTDLTSTHCSS
jgi:hypothetical protein